MSIAVMTAVFRTSLPPSEKVVALALADHAHDDGTEARPGMTSLAVKCSLSDRQVIRVIKSLLEKKILFMQREGSGRSPNCYRFHLDEYGNLTVPRGDNMSPHDGPSGDNPDTVVVTSRARSSDTRVTQTIRTVSEPSLSSSDIASDARLDERFNSARSLCERLADRISANGSKRPSVTTRWITDMDRLVRIDGRTVTQVQNMIDWCQNDQFWRSNILSPAKLREKYDQMRLRAILETPHAAVSDSYGNDDKAEATRKAAIEFEERRRREHAESKPMPESLKATVARMKGIQ